MSKTLQISIPTPCGENWDTMSAARQGRYCQSCSKTVVDFSAMSEQQVFTYFSKAPAGVCGRFSGEQLNRDLFPLKERKPGWLRHLMVMLFPALLLAKNSSAQKIRVAPDSIHMAPPKLPEHPLQGFLGGVSVGVKVRERNVDVSGRVVDEKGMALAGATVMIKGSHKGAATDEKGGFTLQSTAVTEITLVASYVGYEPQEITLDPQKNKRANFIMKPSMRAMQGEVVVVGLVANAVCKKVVPEKSVPTPPPVIVASVNTVPASGKVKLYPNPLPAGASLTLDISQAGEYMLNLSDLSGRVILQKEIYMETKNCRKELSFGGQVRAGMYAAELMNAAGKIVYAGKIWVQ